MDITTGKYGQGSITNKLYLNTFRRNDLTQGWEFCRLKYRVEKGRGKRKKKEVITTPGIHIWSPIQVLTLLKRA